MDIRFEVMGRTVMFDCDARGTRSGFAHDATIIIDGLRVHTAHAYYLNRTWESWRFQSACLACVNDLIDERVNDLKDDYKHDNGISRIYGEKRKQEVADLIAADEKIMFFREIKRILNTQSF